MAKAHDEYEVLASWRDGRRLVDYGEALGILGEGSKGREIEVVAKPFRYVSKSRVDGEWRFRVEALEDFTGSYADVVRRLENNGQILKHGTHKEVLAKLASMCQEVAGAATYGVALDGDGRFYIPDDIFPATTGGQAMYQRLLRDSGALERQPSANDFEAISKLLTGFQFRPHEVLPTMALSAIAGAAHVLRSHHLAMVPHICHVSRTRRTGKSTIADVFSGGIWASKPLHGKSLDKGTFRFDAELDKGCAMTAFHEVEGMGPDFWLQIKASADTGTLAFRGTKDQGMVGYQSRGIFVLTCNHLPPLDAAVLDRLLVLEYDNDRCPDSSNGAELERVRDAVRPLGPNLCEAFVELWPLKADFKEALGEAVHGIEQSYGWLGDRRARIWAEVYLGLRVWERAAKRAGFAWTMPSYAAFCREVVGPVEKAGQQRERSALENFQSWFANYAAQRTRIIHVREDEYGPPTQQNKIAEEGDTFARLEFEGYQVVMATKPLLQSYNKEFQREPTLQIDNLRELQELAQRAYGLPKDKVFGQDGQVLMHRFGAMGQPKRAAVVPLVDETPRGNANPAVTTLQHPLPRSVP